MTPADPRRRAFAEALGRLVAAAVWREVAVGESQPPEGERPASDAALTAAAAADSLRETVGKKTAGPRDNANTVVERVPECEGRAG